jgi:hypothetical protein
LNRFGAGALYTAVLMAEPKENEILTSREIMLPFELARELRSPGDFAPPDNGAAFHSAITLRPASVICIQSTVFSRPPI